MMGRDCYLFGKGFFLFLLSTLFFLSFSFSVFGECVAPTDGMIITESATICGGEYLVSDLKVTGEGIGVVCEGTIFSGNFEGNAITIVNGKDITLKGCGFKGFEVGVLAKNSSGVFLVNNTFQSNKIGVGMFDSADVETSENIYLGSEREDVFIFPVAPMPDSVESILGPEEIRREPSLIITMHLLKKDPTLSDKALEEKVSEALEELSLASTEIEIKRSFSYDTKEGMSTIALVAVPKKTLFNVSLYDSIPKCASEYVSQILFSDKNYEVVESDPLLMWSFSALEVPRSVTYQVSKNLSDECKSLFFEFALAGGTEEQKKPNEAMEDAGNERMLLFGIVAVALVAIFCVLLFRRKMR